ncbi:hypothetical protein WMY93_019439 [Mugilogobius chulae]|uniref:BED-type domain-containing protein n=1 Tax=Mugilogobius chulae TaxID=88201 RepID=A0AAW0NR56_9GOBI
MLRARVAPTAGNVGQEDVMEEAENIVENSPEIKSAPLHFKSKVWEHFGFVTRPGRTDLDMAKAVCKLCRRSLSYCGNTTNLSFHLVRHHPEVKTDQTKRPEVKSRQQTLDGTMCKLPQSCDKAKRVTTSIGQYICKDLRPYSAVEGLGFRNMVYNLEPRYVIPSRKFFAETVIPGMYKEAKTTIRERLSHTERVALSCDAWTSRATDSYVTITAHYIDEDWSLCSHVLQTRTMPDCHTGANLAVLLQEVVQEWGIAEKNVVVVTDNAANMEVATNLSNFEHVKCFAHALNLASQRTMKLPSVARLLGRVRRITSFFHRSPLASRVLEDKQKLLGLPVHKLITDVVTRWNSAFEMVERFLEQQAAVTASLLSPEVRRREKDISTLTEMDISNAEDFIKAMKPMRPIQHFPSSQLLQATNVNGNDSQFVRDMKEAFHSDLSKRYASEVEKNKLHLASALDPRFKGLPFLSEEQKLMTMGRLTAEAAGALEQHADSEADAANQDLTEGAPEETRNLDNCDPDGPPPPKRKDSCALAELLGNAFGDDGNTSGAASEKSALDRAKEEVQVSQLNVCSLLLVTS